MWTLLSIDENCLNKVWRTIGVQMEQKRPRCFGQWSLQFSFSLQIFFYIVFSFLIHILLVHFHSHFDFSPFRFLFIYYCAFRCVAFDVRVRVWEHEIGMQKYVKCPCKSIWIVNATIVNVVSTNTCTFCPWNRWTQLILFYAILFCRFYLSSSMFFSSYFQNWLFQFSYFIRSSFLVYFSSILLSSLDFPIEVKKMIEKASKQNEKDRHN